MQVDHVLKGLKGKIDIKSHIQSADEEATKLASDVVNELMMDESVLSESERSIFNRRTATWETGSTTTDAGRSDDNDGAFFKCLDEYGGDCSDDEDEATDDGDEFVADCGPSFNAVTGRVRASDEDLRHYAMMQPLCELAKAECSKGTRGRCRHGGDCCGKITNREVWELRSKFWNFEFVKAATTSERNVKIMDLLKLFFDPATGNFNYFVSTMRNGQSRQIQVCERSYLTLLGYHSKSSQWARCKTKVRGLLDSSSHPSSKRRRENSKTKFDAARAWLKRYCDGRSDHLIHQSDLRRQGERIDADSERVRIKSVPFESNKRFYEHYRSDVAHLSAKFAGRTCFDRALESFSSSSLKNEGYVVRMRRCKHNFSTCDICNNAEALLQGGRAITSLQRKILNEYLDVHLKIQYAERQEQALAMHDARQLDHLGQPKQALWRKVSH